MSAPARPLLYSFRRCPYAMRARLVIAHAGVQVDLCEVSLRDKPADLLALSPKGTVPVLHLPSGAVLEQSLDIMRWALAHSDPQDWLYQRADPANPDPVAAQQQAALWLARNDGAFKRALDAYKYPERHPAQAQAAHREDAVVALLAPLQAQLAVTPHVLGSRTSYVDAALLPFVRQFAAVDRAWFAQDGTRRFPDVARWLQNWLDSELFTTVMAKPAIG
jgi:glutathione S-transferase